VKGHGGAFTVETRLEAREGDKQIFARDTTMRVPRKAV